MKENHISGGQHLAADPTDRATEDAIYWWRRGMEDAARIAEAHIGSAGRQRRERKIKHDSEAMASIRDEERGEDIAAAEIARKIRAWIQRGVS